MRGASLSNSFKFVLVIIFCASLGSGCYNRSNTLQAPLAIAYAEQDFLFLQGIPVEIPGPAIDGSAVEEFSVEPDLPAGLVLNPETGAISGTPLEISTTGFFTITARNFGGLTSTTLAITIHPQAPCGLSYSADDVVFMAEFEADPITADFGCGPVYDWEADPALPQGLLLDQQSGTISGTPTEIRSRVEYLITGSNVTGSATSIVAIEVLTPAPCSLQYSESDTVYPPFSEIDPNLPSTACGEVVTWTISPELPEGLSFDSTTGIITGSPLVEDDGVFYTVSASNDFGSVDSIVKIRISPVFTYSGADIFGEYDPQSGEGTFEARLTVREGQNNTTFPTQIIALSLALAHDENVVSLDGVEPSLELGSFNGDQGVDFFAPFSTPVGFTLGIVFSFTPSGNGLLAEEESEVAVAAYRLLPGSVLGNLDGVQTSLVWGNPTSGQEGSTSVDNTVVLGGTTGVRPVVIDISVGMTPMEP